MHLHWYPVQRQNLRDQWSVLFLCCLQTERLRSNQENNMTEISNLLYPWVQLSNILSVKLLIVQIFTTKSAVNFGWEMRTIFFENTQREQGKHPGSPPPKKFKRFHSAGKVMISIFWDSPEVIVIHYLEQDRTINGAYYEGKLGRTRQGISRKRRGKTESRCSALTDQCPCRHVTSCHDCCDWLWIWNPSSSDIAPSDFYLFPKLKSLLLGGTQYGSYEGVTEAVNSTWGTRQRLSILKG